MQQNAYGKAVVIILPFLFINYLATYFPHSQTVVFTSRNIHRMYIRMSQYYIFTSIHFSLEYQLILLQISNQHALNDGYLHYLFCSGVLERVAVNHFAQADNNTIHNISIVTCCIGQSPIYVTGAECAAFYHKVDI